jgi:hypothetical protein
MCWFLRLLPQGHSQQKRNGKIGTFAFLETGILTLDRALAFGLRLRWVCGGGGERGGGRRIVVLCVEGRNFTGCQAVRWVGSGSPSQA